MQRISTSLVQITRLDLNETVTTSDMRVFPSSLKLRALVPLCSLQHLRKLGSSRLECDDLSSMSKLPCTEICVPRLKSNTDNVQFAAWVRSSGQSLESVSIGSLVGQLQGRERDIVSLEAQTSAPQLKTLCLISVSLCVAELALLTQLSSLELVDCIVRDADLCKSVVMPNVRSLQWTVVCGAEAVHSAMHFLEAGFPQLIELRVDNMTAAAKAEAGFKDRIVGTDKWNRFGTDVWDFTLLPASPA